MHRIFQLQLILILTNVFAHDIIIYSATPAGIAAAITAARTSPSLQIALIEPSANIGGMSAAGGIGLRDLGLEETIIGTVAFDWVQNNAKYYNGTKTKVYQPDMNISQQSFLDLLTQYKNIELVTSIGPILRPSLVMNGSRIISLGTWTASVWIDASYDGDLTRFTGATYTYGRESVSQYNESYAGVRPYTSFGNFLPNYPVNATLENGTLAPYISPDQLLPVGNADDNMMGYSYRLCLTPTQSKQAPFPKPSNYNETNFVILQRYIDSLIATGKYPNGPPFETLVDVFSYRNYPNGDKFDMCDSATSGFTSDAINLNKGYVMKTAEERKEIEQITYDYVMGLIWYILTSSLVPEHTRTTLQRYGLCNDQWNDNNHIPPQMYVREGLRLVNDHVFTQNHIVSGQCYEDSVALGSWGYDIHVVTRTANLSHVNNEGQLVAKIAKLPNSKSGPVFEIPYTIMVPSHNQVTNLLVPVCHAATHVAYSATRVEPHFMQLGGAAGYAAAWSVLTGNVDVQKVDVIAVQKYLMNDGALLHYPKGHCD